MTATALRSLRAPQALLPSGWAADVRLTWDDRGHLTDVAPGSALAPGVAQAPGPVVPGMPNLHSHAFQRAFAGLTEYRAAAHGDSFWTWRDLMYRFALAVGPAQLEAIATQLYIEMLRAGYTSVCEFHYLHHDPAGRAYADPAEMALRLAAAARTAGIRLTLLPVLYQASGFGARPPRPEQRRFVASVDGLLRIVERLQHEGLAVGVAPHSLRAVGAPALAELVAGIDAMAPRAPIHIHIAEQMQEVDDCVAATGMRPVQWLAGRVTLDQRWCLVHATHLDAAEQRMLAESGATAGLCPSTEANLGDGVFDAAAHAAAGGHWGIGSDSHASVDAAGELRLLEYGQRLMLRRRSVLADASRPQVAEFLWLAAAAGGARASGRAAAGLAVGAPADLVVLDAGAELAGLTAPQVLASHVFADHGRRGVHSVWVAGRPVVVEGRHAGGEAAVHAFVAARNALLKDA